MNRNTVLTLVAIATSTMVACGGGAGDPDAGTQDDAGRDAGGRDSGPVMIDAGTDAGPPPPSCTSGCAIVELALGSDHSCARRENGEVLCWGRDQEGQLGDVRDRHEQCGSTGSEPQDCSGAAVRVQRTGTGSPVLDDAVQISTQGSSTVCALRESGETWCWGFRLRASTMPTVSRTAERFGDFAEIHRISEGSLHRCLIQGTDRIAVCSGFNGAGQLGVGDLMNIDMPSLTTPVLDPTGTSPITGMQEIHVSGWGDNTCARTNDTVYCWGNNVDGQVGDNMPPFDTCFEDGRPFDCVNLPRSVPLTDVAQLTVGRRHACVLRSGTLAGRLDCWGDNRARQLGDATAPSLPSPTEVAGITGVAQVVAGAYFTCARSTAGAVHCWGLNRYGQVGDGMTSHGETCTIGSTIGDCAAAPVQVSGIDDATFIAAGSSHACAIRASGEVWCWGSNNNKQIGDNTQIDRAAPVRVTAIPQ